MAKSSTYKGDRMEYVSKVVDPIVEELVHDILIEYPKDPVAFSIAWLKKRGGGLTGNTERLSVMGENRNIRESLKNMTALVQEIGEAVSVEKKLTIQSGGEQSSEEEDDDDDELDEPPPPPNRGKARQSVSAEAYGDWNKVQVFTLPKHAKNAEQKLRLQNVLSLSFLFSDLEEQETTAILDAFEEKNFRDERVIAEGDDGDCLYVLESGVLECKKIIEGQEKVVKSCVPGDVFGELALLYNCPRAASVDAAGKCVCWKLDRGTFHQVVKQSHQKRAEKYDEFVQSISLFSTMEQTERARIVECFKIVRFKQGESVVRQGEDGDRFFVVEEGTAEARKVFPDGEEKTVMPYGHGDYFGELALLKNQPRAASVVVTSPQAKLVWLDRRTFTKMLGPLQGILDRRVASYN